MKSHRDIDIPPILFHLFKTAIPSLNLSVIPITEFIEKSALFDYNRKSTRKKETSVFPTAIPTAKTEVTSEDKIVFCKGGVCTAKLEAGILSRVLERLPKGEEDPNLLIGYDSKDDAAVYKVTDDLAIVHTMDFFLPMVEAPYTFGKIAATNALSDIFAMGGTVKTALNIVCFPEKMTQADLIVKP